MVQQALLSPETLVSEFQKNGVTHVITIPDSETNFMYQQMVSEPSLDLVPVCREGESMAIAAGLWVGGKAPVLLLLYSIVLGAHAFDPIARHDHLAVGDLEADVHHPVLHLGTELEAAFLGHGSESVNLPQPAAKSLLVEAHRLLGLAVEIEVRMDLHGRTLLVSRYALRGDRCNPQYEPVRLVPRHMAWYIWPCVQQEVSYERC
jgi:hypothetical protein